MKYGIVIGIIVGLLFFQIVNAGILDKIFGFNIAETDFPIQLGGDVEWDSDLIPVTDNDVDLGSSTKRVKDGWFVRLISGTVSTTDFISIGGDDNLDDDYLYFDTREESLRWDNALMLFKLSDDLVVQTITPVTDNLYDLGDDSLFWDDLLMKGTIFTGDGILDIGGIGGGNNEDLVFDFETTANEVGISSGSGATKIDFGTLNLSMANATTTGSMYIGNDLKVVSTLDVDGHSAFGADGIISPQFIMILDETQTQDEGLGALRILHTINPAIASVGKGYTAVEGFLQIDNTNFTNAKFHGLQYGVYGKVFGNSGSNSSIARGIAVWGVSGFSSTWTMDEVYAIDVIPVDEGTFLGGGASAVSLTATNLFGIRIRDADNIGGTITNQIQLQIDKPTEATNNRQLVLIGTAAGTGIWLGGINGERITTLAADSLDFKTNSFDWGANQNVNISFDFDATTFDGNFTWMEDENYFAYSDDILMNTTEKLYFRDTAIGIYSQADSYLDLFADGGVRIGDSSAGAPTNYVDIKPDGEINLAGTARVWKTDALSPAVVKLPGANPPLEDTIDAFPFHRYDRGTEESVFFLWHIPSDYGTGSGNVKGHYEFVVGNPPTSGGTNQPENVRMGFEWLKLSENDVFDFAVPDGSGYIDETIAVDEAAWIIHMTSDGVLPTTGWVAGDVILFRFYRDATADEDTYDNEVVAADNDVWLYGYNLEYLSDRLGEAL